MSLAAQIQPMPRHVAIIMDGNGRWASARSLSRSAGHREGAKAVRAVVETCARSGVQVLTLFAFSSENWQRPRSEVAVLMELFMHTLERESAALAKNGVRLRLIGDRTRFSRRLQRQIDKAEQLTAQGERME